MDSKIQRWGNSLAVRIPKAFAEQAGLEEDANVDISLEGRSIVVRARKKKLKLEDLLKGVTKANTPKPIDWGPPVGKEVW
jgi:antitoxin MazE